ncbi:MAG: hypothetical protein ACOZBW_12375 [Thermodesulfobacteriota bacterium]
MTNGLIETLTATANHARYTGEQNGFYESYFLRANHPALPLAFWIRYTIFAPRNNPAGALGELWATWFDGATGRHVSVKDEFSLADCRFDNSRFAVNAGASTLERGRASGRAGKDSAVAWDLAYTGDSPPLFLFDPKLYGTRLPKAKTLVGLPMARFSGTLTVAGTPHRVDNWVGSQNHNWGVKHTDYYAWGQVAGFDNSMESFLEIATAQLKFGPVYTPRMTVMVLRHKGREYALNTIGQSLKARGKLGYFSWDFASENQDVRIEGSMAAAKEAFVGLQYYNPPGGIKHCLNTKIASCRLSVMLKGSGAREELTTDHRAAFEILTDDHQGHGVPIYA